MRFERVTMLPTDGPVVVVRRPGHGPVVRLNAVLVTEADAIRIEQRLRADRALINAIPGT